MAQKERTFIPRAEQPATDVPAAAPVTPENIEQVLAEAPAPVPKRSDVLREQAPEWMASTTAARLRQSINFLHAFGFIPDSEAIRMKAEVDEQERP